MSPTFLAVILLIVCGSLVVISDEWRLRLLALVFQHVALAILFAFEVFPALGIVRLVAGAIAAMVLFQSLRYLTGDRMGREGGQHVSPSFFLRVACVLLSMAISVGLAQAYPLPTFSRDVTIGAYWLVLSSLCSLLLSQDVLRIGFALLMLEMAAALVAGVMVETANLARFLLASLSSIVLALAVAFLVGQDLEASTAGEVES